MSIIPFSFGNAMSHWSRTEGPQGFVWKFALAYAGAAIVVAVVGFLLGGMGALTGDIGQVEIVRLIIYYVWSIVAGVLVWAMFEAAGQRRYLRGEGLSLRIGGDEGRLIVVGLLMIVSILAMYLGIAFVVGLLVVAGGAVSPELGGLLGIVSGIAGFGFLVFMLVRLSPAAAMTVRDGHIRFPSAFTATKGRFWPLFGAYVVMSLIVLVAVIFLYLIIIAIGMGVVFSTTEVGSGGGFDEDVVMALISNPLVILLGLMLLLGVYIFQGLVMFVFQGIPALAAKTDPNWAGAGSAADTFG